MFGLQNIVGTLVFSTVALSLTIQTFKNKIVKESLKFGSLSISQSSRLGVMINMSSAAARTRNCVSGLIVVELSINTAEHRRFDMKLKFRRNICVEGVLSRLDKFQASDDFGRLLGFLVIGSVMRYRRIFQRVPCRDIFPESRRGRSENLFNVISDAYKGAEKFYSPRRRSRLRFSF